MAAGDFLLFDEWLKILADGKADLDTDSFKLALIDSVITPTVGDATPAWAAGSGVDYDGNQVSPIGTQYLTTGNVVSGNFLTSEAAGVLKWDPGAGPHQNLAQDAGGPTNIRWGILYDDTTAGKEAVGFVDYGAVISLVDGAITYTFDETNGILTIS